MCFDGLQNSNLVKNKLFLRNDILFFVSPLIYFFIRYYTMARSIK